jgi:hypothetical protein
VNDQEATKLRDNVAALFNRSLDEQLTLDALLAMVAALVETHPDKGVLHAAFSRNYSELGGADNAVQAMAFGNTGSIAALAGLSRAIGRELP